MAIGIDQQWVQDWIIREVGASVNAERGERLYPPAVRTESMIPKVLGQLAERQLAMASKAEAAGHRQTALRAYELALRHFIEAQHNIFWDCPLKRQLMERARACMDGIIRLAPHRIDRVEIPFEGAMLPGLLHRGNENRPLLLFIPGMDGTKETSGIGPLAGPILSRGFRAFSFDGPGQGESRVLRGVRLEPRKYARAVKAALDHLQSMGVWDGREVWVLGSSMGSRWGLEAAWLDSRIKGLALIHSTYGIQERFFYATPPRFRKVLAYMTGLQTEEDLRQFMRASELPPELQVSCPTLICSGEFDPMTTVAEARAVYRDRLRGAKVLYIFENAFHGSQQLDALCGLNGVEIALDWLWDVATGKAVESGEFRIPAEHGGGPYDREPLDVWQTGLEAGHGGS